MGTEFAVAPEVLTAEIDDLLAALARERLVRP